MPRRCEVLTDQQTWREIALADVKAGMVFRLFEADGTQVEDDDVGGPGRWRALADATTGADGVAVVDAETLPESSIEHAVHTHGMFWPGAAGAPPPGTFDPGRLR